LDEAFNAVADDFVSPEPHGLILRSPFGSFYSGLTYDDVGGLEFLLSTNNLNMETLLSDVHSATTNTAIVNMAFRPGVDKISFVRQPQDSATALFQPLTNGFADAFVLNGQLLHQDVKRTTSRPDILFSADDTGKQGQHTISVLRTGITNWINNWELNGDTNRLGPGVIAPPIKIVFHRLGPSVGTAEPNPEQNAFSSGSGWGWFDETTNTPIAFPNFNLGEAHPLTVRLRLYPTRPSVDSLIWSPSLSNAWQLPVPIGGTAQLQTSTNMLSWLPVMTLTNNGEIVEWFHSGTSLTSRFFRVVPGTGQN
jgi:hypothetical protein